MRNIAIAVLLVLTAGVVGFAVSLWYREGFRAPPSHPTAQTAVVADSGSDNDAGATTTGADAIPKKLPVFKLKDSTGRLRSIEEWRGKSLAVNFWATWCPPCLREIPLLKKLNAQRTLQNIQVIGVAVDFHDAVVAYMKKARIDYPVLIGEQDGIEAAQALGVGQVGFPFTVFTDDQGRIVTLYMGELHEDKANKILDIVVALNAGTLTLAQAQKALAPMG